MGRPLLLVSSYLDTGTRRSSDITVNHPSWTYEPDVLNWGTVDRSLAIPPGPPVIGTMELDLIDTPDPSTGVQFWRTTLDTKSQLRRKVEIKLGEVGVSEALASTPYVGEFVAPAVFPPDRARLPGKDIWHRVLERQIPPLGTRENFPNMPDNIDGFFFPLVFGTCESTDPAQLGVIPLTLCNTVTNDYAVNRLPTVSISAVYRKLPGDDFFTLVNPAEWSQVQILRTIGSAQYYLTVARFTVAEPDGSELRADVVGGCGLRASFGSMGAGSGELRNVVDHVINMLALMFPPITAAPPPLDLGMVQALCDTDSFAVAHAYYDANALPVDGAIVDPMNYRSALTQILTAGQLHLFQNNAGLLAVKLNAAADASRPVFTEAHDILRFVNGSEVEITPSQPDETFNTFNYSFAKNFATGNYALHDTYENLDDMGELGGHIEELPVNFEFIRDPATALWAIHQWASYFTLRSYRCELSVQAVGNVDKIDLGKSIGVTYYGGLGGAWINKEFLIYGIQFVLSELRYIVRAIHRPFPFPA